MHESASLLDPVALLTRVGAVVDREWHTCEVRARAAPDDGAAVAQVGDGEDPLPILVVHDDAYRASTALLTLLVVQLLQPLLHPLKPNRHRRSDHTPHIDVSIPVVLCGLLNGVGDVPRQLLRALLRRLIPPVTIKDRKERDRPRGRLLKQTRPRPLREEVGELEQRHPVLVGVHHTPPRDAPDGHARGLLLLVLLLLCGCGLLRVRRRSSRHGAAA
mmetsp:Transcript_10227/g.25267  ORF Transcript_10227/g.25267 Transcript_10227/m.25267 type:complete len:217 (-) Transcript_10227:162-812(-)